MKSINKIFASVLLALVVITNVGIVYASTNTYSATVVRASSQYFSAPDSASFDAITGDFTLECWVKIVSQPGLNQTYALVMKDTLNVNRSWALMYHDVAGVPKLETLYYGANPPVLNFNQAQVSYTLPTDTWTHVALVVTIANSQATQPEWFINGVSIGNGASAGGSGTSSIVNSSAAFAIGGVSGGLAGFYTDAKIDEVRVWNVARTSGQISANYNTQLVGNETGLQAYYQLNNGLTDTTANGNTLTNNNSATFTTDVPFTGASAATFSIWQFLDF